VSQTELKIRLHCANSAIRLFVLGSWIMKTLLGIVVLGLLLSSNAYAETGKNLNWCKQNTKIKYPFYIYGEKN